MLKHLDAKVVQRLGTAMAQLKTASRDEVNEVVGGFVMTMDSQADIKVGSDDYIRRVLTDALGDEKASGIIDRIQVGRKSKGLDVLKWMEPRQIAEIRSLIKSLAGEHTVILSTHILPEVSMVCSGVVIINQGAIVAQGPIDRLVEEFFPTARVEVEIAGPRGAVLEGLRAIPGVLRIDDGSLAGETARFMVESARGRDVRGEIFQLAAQQKWNLLELRPVGMTLEEVFIRIVAGEESEAVTGKPETSTEAVS